MNIRELSLEIAAMSGAILAELNTEQRDAIKGCDDPQYLLRLMMILPIRLSPLVFEYLGVVRAAEILGFGLVRGESGLYIGCCE